MRSSKPSIRRALLRSDIRAAAPQNIFLDLPGGGFGQSGEESEALRDFEMRQMIPRKLPQLSVGRGCARFEDHKGMRRFAPLLVGHTHDRDFLNGRMPQQQSFNFNG